MKREFRDTWDHYIVGLLKINNYFDRVVRIERSAFRQYAALLIVTCCLFFMSLINNEIYATFFVFIVLVSNVIQLRLCSSRLNIANKENAEILRQIKTLKQLEES